MGNFFVELGYLAYLPLGPLPLWEALEYCYPHSSWTGSLSRSPRFLSQGKDHATLTEQEECLTLGQSLKGRQLSQTARTLKKGGFANNDRSITCS